MSSSQPPNLAKALGTDLSLISREGGHFSYLSMSDHIVRLLFVESGKRETCVDRVCLNTVPSRAVKSCIMNHIS